LPRRQAKRPCRGSRASPPGRRNRDTRSRRRPTRIQPRRAGKALRRRRADLSGSRFRRTGCRCGWSRASEDKCGFRHCFVATERICQLYSICRCAFLNAPASPFPKTSTSWIGIACLSRDMFFGESRCR
jgi:hypothetical protein